MAYEPRTLVHPETGEQIVASSAKEFTNLRFAGGYVPLEQVNDRAEKAESPKKQAPKAAPKNEPAPTRAEPDPS